MSTLQHNFNAFEILHQCFNLPTALDTKNGIGTQVAIGLNYFSPTHDNNDFFTAFCQLQFCQHALNTNANQLLVTSSLDSTWLLSCCNMVISSFLIHSFHTALQTQCCLIILYTAYMYQIKQWQLSSQNINSVIYFNFDVIISILFPYVLSM